MSIDELKRGQQFGRHLEYELINDPQQPRAARRLKPLGEGGAGTVFCAQLKGGDSRLIRAVKFLDPKSGTSEQPSDQFVATFIKERHFLAQLTHQNIVKLLDSGSIDQPDGALPFLVMEIVRGEKLSSVASKDEVNGTELYRILETLLDAVSYLHDERILHADIKDSNILCSHRGSQLEPILLDLGAAHHVPESDSGQLRVPEISLASADDFTLFVSTRRIAHDRHKQLIGKLISREQIQDLFPYYDLHAVGMLIDELLATEAICIKLRIYLGSDSFTALKALVARLLQPPESAFYRSASKLREDWRRLRPTYLAPLGVPELSLAASFHHSLLSGSGRVTITDRLHHVLDNVAMQRLRLIPQLEYVSLKYPGAMHTRFEHAISTYRNARLYLAHLLNHADFRLSAATCDIEATLLLALTHDIGHYQLSHMFEDFAAESRRSPNTDRSQHITPETVATDDDLWSAVFDPAASDQSHWAEACSDALGQDQRPLKEIIEREFGDEVVAAMRQIRSVLYGTPSRASDVHQTVAGILSSPIDVDKISYLIDDSLETGISFGSGVDLDGLLGALIPPTEADLRDGPALGISDKGIAAVESAVVARQLMIRQVYWHHTNRACMAMVKRVIGVLRRNHALRFKDYFQSTFFMSLSEASSFLHSAFDRAREAGEIDLLEENSMSGLQRARRGVYKRVYTIPKSSDQATRRIHSFLSSQTHESLLDVEDALGTYLSTAGFCKHARPGEVLIDVPVKDRGRLGGSRSARLMVYARDASGRSSDIEDYTHWMKDAEAEHDAQANKSRVYVHPRFIDGDDDALPGIRRATREWLIERANVSGV